MLEIRNLNVNLGKFFLEDVNLTLKSGEYLVIIGKSGTGKTVLLETIAGRYPITSGSIIKGKTDISDAQPELRDIGFVYQNYELFSHLRVEENISFPLKIKKISKRERRLQTDEMMEILNITHLKDRYPEALSGGEKQRVAIGRSLIKSPKLLLLDEPFSALDYVTKENIKDVLKNVHERFKPTVIHVTHDLKEAMYFADTIGVIKDNTIKKVFDRGEINNLESEEILYEHI